jgi:hypothetical protein
VRLLLRCETVSTVYSRGTESKVAIKTNKVVSSEGLHKDVCNIVNRADPCNSELVVSHQIIDRVIFDTNVFDLWMPNIVFCQMTCHIVVTMEKGGSSLRHTYALKQLMKEKGFMRCIM